MLDAHSSGAQLDDEYRAGGEIGYQVARPPEAPTTEWAKWSEPTRYIYSERLSISEDKYIALNEARANHADENKGLFRDPHTAFPSKHVYRWADAKFIADDNKVVF